ncbi:MAG: DUF3458 domain-containing protein, partial [Rhodobiaceae bacterium]|nr:DUF3458 domain-containing protein [Rhodobiaceae bacterium]
FHNWTGNRITCRDWFQLCLKEGLTVFRDQEFSGDMRSEPVKRIQDVRLLRSHQFPEDDGPLAHSVRPEEYREISNFYTATVYEKGAELIRMLRSIIGEDAFTRGMDLYFDRMDGTAATVEDFIGCFEDAAGEDLSHFMRWYEQAGTPRLSVTRDYDEKARRLTLKIDQHTPATPKQMAKLAVPIPLRLGLVGANGAEVPLEPAGDTTLIDGNTLVVDEAHETLVLENVPPRTVPSLLRGFSAPVRLTDDLTAEDLSFLMRHDGDPFNRWEAAQALMSRTLVAGQAALKAGREPQFESALVDAMRETVLDDRFDNAYRALFLALPGESEIAQQVGKDVDPDAIHGAASRLRAMLAAAMAGDLADLAGALTGSDAYSPDAAAAGRRALRNAALGFLASAPDATHRAIVEAAWRTADNMTDLLAALTLLVHRQLPAADEALADFEGRFSGNALVMDKWLTVQATAPNAGTLERTRDIMKSGDFDFGNPNRLRALVGAFATANPTRFNRPDGAGYEFVADTVIATDKRNPQVAARLMGAFRSWRSLEPVRREKAETAIRKVAATKDLSRDVSDIVSRTLD